MRLVFLAVRYGFTSVDSSCSKLPLISAMIYQAFYAISFRTHGQELHRTRILYANTLELCLRFQDMLISKVLDKNIGLYCWRSAI